MLQCIVVTPEATIRDELAEFVALPLFDGEIGIAQGHSPMIGRLGAGEMRIRDEAGATARYYIEGGFVEVVNNVVSVLTGRAVPAKSIDATVAQQDLEAALVRKANSPELMQIRDRAVTAARAQLRVAKHER